MVVFGVCLFNVDGWYLSTMIVTYWWLTVICSGFIILSDVFNMCLRISIISNLCCWFANI